MKTSTLVVMVAFLMSAAVPVFALTSQEQLICALSGNNCPDEAKNLQMRIVDIKNEIKKGANYSPEEMKMLEQRLKDTTDQLNKIEGN